MAFVVHFSPFDGRRVSSPNPKKKNPVTLWLVSFAKILHHKINKFLDPGVRGLLQTSRENEKYASKQHFTLFSQCFLPYERKI